MSNQRQKWPGAFEGRKGGNRDCRRASQPEVRSMRREGRADAELRGSLVAWLFNTAQLPKSPKLMWPHWLGYSVLESKTVTFPSSRKGS